MKAVLFGLLLIWAVAIAEEQKFSNFLYNKGIKFDKEASKAAYLRQLGKEDERVKFTEEWAIHLDECNYKIDTLKFQRNILPVLHLVASKPS